MMASRAPAYDATPLDVLLASVPSLPRAILSRLTARMIDRMDELDGNVVGYRRLSEGEPVQHPSAGRGTVRHQRLAIEG
jgi:hypothetical protein